MCKCTPGIRTPYCNKGDCVLPGTKNPGQREGAAAEMSGEIHRPELPPMGHPLQKLGAALTNLLDDDQFNNIEQYLIHAREHENRRATPPGYEMDRNQDAEYIRRFEALNRRILQLEAQNEGLIKIIANVTPPPQIVFEYPETGIVGYEMVPEGTMAVLRDLEWTFDGDWCNVCESHKNSGHADDCKLAAILTRHRATQKPQETPNAQG